METTWQNTLEQLTGYIKQNPEISIGKNLTIIPAEVRTEFYRLFDKVEADFVREHAPGPLKQGCELSAVWFEAAVALKSKLGLESLVIAQSVMWFLNDPLDGLTRALSDPLFQVLKGESDSAAFAEKSRKLIDSGFNNFFSTGYRYWIELSLLNQLAPEKNYVVPAIDEIADALIGEGHENPGQHKALVPDAEQSKRLLLQQHPVVSFVVPKALVWSTRLGRYVAMHSEFVEPQWTAREISRNVEWLDYTALKRDNGLARIRPDQKLLPDLTKILPDIAFYLGDELFDVSLVADHSHILRPAVSVEVMEDPGWFEKGGLARIKLHHSVMKPEFGTFVICLAPPPQAAVDELAPKPAPIDLAVEATATVIPPEPPLDIHLVWVGFERSRLEPVIKALETSKNC
jgi:hypothetical protein